MVVDFEEALRIVAAHATGQAAKGPSERKGLLAAAGSVLAEPVLADRDQPGFDRSTRDGYAVRAAELTAGELVVAGQVRAGERWEKGLRAGEAVQIMTGAPVPADADSVVMVEHVSVEAGKLRLLAGRTLSAGENVVPQGSEARAGVEVIPVGVAVGAAEIALAASCGYAELLLAPKPTVAIVATGDELVEVAETPGPNQIRNSNSYAIAAMVAAAGGQADRLAIARDTLQEVRDRVVEGRRSGLLVFSGGVSMGDYDLVEEVLAGFGAEFFFTGVRMQPGKPVVFGRLPADSDAPACYFFGLPGNPISTQVTFGCFVAPMIRAMSGEGWRGPDFVQATLSQSVEPKAGLTRLLPALREGVGVRVVGWQGSGDLAANARANCYAELLPGQAHAAGDVIRVLLR